MNQITSYWIAVLVMALSTPLGAQVFDPGPSDPNLFDNVIDLPVDQADISGSVGGDSMTTQLNVNLYGSVISSVNNVFEALADSEVNVTGGTVGNSFAAREGSEVNIMAGFVDDFFDASAGSLVNINGGVVARYD